NENALGNLKPANHKAFLRQKPPLRARFAVNNRLRRNISATNILGEKLTNRRHDSAAFKPVHNDVPITGSFTFNWGRYNQIFRILIVTEHSKTDIALWVHVHCLTT